MQVRRWLGMVALAPAFILVLFVFFFVGDSFGLKDTPAIRMAVVCTAITVFLIGWWLGQLAIFAAWFWNLLVITLPLGLFILNRLPQIITLRPATQDLEGAVLRDQPQRTLILRALYFVLVGWWFSFLWL